MQAKGVNLALGKQATALVTYAGLDPAYAVDGDSSTIWASDGVEKLPWLQIDLGSAQTIGRVEVLARQDGDQPGARCFFDIRGSNTADFSKSTFLATPGAIPFPAYGTWGQNINSAQQFRYIRLVRNNNSGHITLAELRVFDTADPDSIIENALTYPQGNNSLITGNKMLILKSSGKAMDVPDSSTANVIGVIQSSYRFSESQQWSINDLGGGEYSIVNAKSSLCLDIYGGNFTDGTAVIEYGINGGGNQKWNFVAQAGGFYSIQNIGSGKCLQVNNDSLVIGTFSSAENQLWRVTDAYVQYPKHSNTDWISAAQYGIFMHWLLDGTNKKLNDQFDVNYLADQLVEAGAKYFILTLGQNSGYYVSPNATFDAYTAYPSGDHLLTRDLPADLFDALTTRGLKLMLYLPCEVANQDSNEQKSFGLPVGAFDQKLTMEFAMKWAQVIQEWSDRYGDKISGFWFDGGWGQLNVNNAIFDVYTNAVKHGNHNAVVAFNPGVMVTPNARAEDYTAGETNEPFNLSLPDDRFIGGKQWHSLTYLGATWAQRLPRDTAANWINWMTKVFSKGGAITIDAGPNYDPNAAPVGSISEEMMVYFRQFKTAFQTVTYIDKEVSGAISLYPNPVKSELMISNMNQLVTRITIFDLQGQVVSDFFPPFSNEKNIQLNGLNAGMYCVKICSNDEVIARKMIKE